MLRMTFSAGYIIDNNFANLYCRAVKKEWSEYFLLRIMDINKELEIFLKLIYIRIFKVSVIKYAE